jgi:hypothetical protein
MNLRIHPHARLRMVERGITEEEIIQTIDTGERFAAKYGRQGFRREFIFGKAWQGKSYAMKQIEVYAVVENEEHVVITALAKYY